MKIKPGYYNIKEEPNGSIILTPLEANTVPRLAKAPKYTPIKVRDSGGSGKWSHRGAGEYVPDKGFKWVDANGTAWKYARLTSGYKYTWDPSWELFMEDDLEVKVWRANRAENTRLVKDFNWYDLCGSRIVGFEVIEK